MTDRKNLVKFTQLSILVAIIAILAFTPIGFLRIGVIEITFLTIPVVVGAISLGPGAGALLGGAFGIASLIQCFGISGFGGALLQINPIYTAILCIVPRILVGFGSGLIFKWLSRADKKQVIACFAASLSGALINTVLFVGGVILLFGKSEYISAMQDNRNLAQFFIAFIGINGVVEAIATCIIGGAIGKSLLTVTKQRKV